MTGIPTDRWLEVLRSSVTTVSGTMGFDAMVAAEGAAVMKPDSGSFISLSSGSNAVEIGVQSSTGGCRSLAAMLLAMEPEEAESLEEGDVADGVGEFVNMLAGVVKTAIAAEDGGLQIGLPMFVEGRVDAGSAATVSRIGCELGGTPCMIELIVARPKRAA